MLGISKLIYQILNTRLHGITPKYMRALLANKYKGCFLHLQTNHGTNMVIKDLLYLHKSRVLLLILVNNIILEQCTRVQ